MRISTAQLPKSPHGADRVVATGNAVVVLDGASAIESVSIPPGVYADYLGASITAALTARPEAALAGILAEAIEAAARSLGLTGEDCPSSTVAMARMTGGPRWAFLNSGNTGSGCGLAAATTPRTGHCCAVSSASSVSTVTARKATGSRKRTRPRPGTRAPSRCLRLQRAGRSSPQMAP